MADELLLLTEANLANPLKVKAKDGHTVGSVHAFMVHKRSGRATHAVLSLGGFLGMGRSYYPVPFQLLAWDHAHDQYVVGVDAKVMEGGPSWANSAPEFDQAYADRVASYFGVPRQDLTLG